MIIIDTVVQARGLGRKLGYPTANLAHRHRIRAGVYAAEVVIAGTMHQGFLIVGAFKKPDLTLAEEVHVLDFNGDLYHTMVQVDVKKKLRAMKKFKSDDELKGQIHNDIVCLRALLPTLVR